MQEIIYRYIDPNVLMRLVLGDLAMFRKMSQTFLDIGPPMLAKVEVALQAGSAAKLAPACHSLRGAATLIGAEQLTAMLTEMEMAAKADQKIDHSRLITELHHLFSQTVQEVQTSMLSFRGGSASTETDAVKQASPCI